MCREDGPIMVLCGVQGGWAFYNPIWCVVWSEWCLVGWVGSLNCFICFTSEYTSVYVNVELLAIWLM